jgi:hypothetical protein
MKTSQKNRIRNLRFSAEHCRVLARGALPFAVAREIEAFADDLEADAARIEQSQHSARHKVAPRKGTASAADPDRLATRRKVLQGCA